MIQLKEFIDNLINYASDPLKTASDGLNKVGYLAKKVQYNDFIKMEKVARTLKKC